MERFSIPLEKTANIEKCQYLINTVPRPKDHNNILSVIPSERNYIVMVQSYLPQTLPQPPTVCFLPSTGDLHGHLEDLLLIFYKVLGT